MVSHVTEHLPTPASVSASPAQVPLRAAPVLRQSLRFGLVGTGYWARVAHARALASVPGIQFASVWGRNPEAAAAVAADHGISSHADFDAFLADVDGVAFSVPPDVQSELAVRAAQAGKHLLLEKPVAMTETAAEALVTAVRAAGVASVVSSPAAFSPTSRPGWRISQ
jgi:predicted dehydrogenase